MFKIFLTFWKNRTMTEKVLIILLIAASFYGIYQGIQNDLYVRGREKQLTKENELLQQEIADHNKKETKIINTGKRVTKKAETLKTKIDQQLKKDETKIDSSGISDDELHDFLAKHGEDID